LCFILPQEADFLEKIQDKSFGSKVSFFSEKGVFNLRRGTPASRQQDELDSMKEYVILEVRQA